MQNKKLLFLFALCPFPAFTPADQVHLSSDKVLIVTHPTSKYDGRFVTKRGIDESVKRAQANHVPVIYLWEPDQKLNPFYFPEQCTVDYTLSSVEGEHALTHLPNHVLSAGGRLDACQLRTMRDVFKDWGKNKRSEDLTFTIIANATYLYGERIYPDNLEFELWRKEMDRITATKETDYDENGENPKRILSLTEMIGIMTDSEEELGWGRVSRLNTLRLLSQHIADTTPIPPQYQIEYRYMKRRKIYRESSIKDPKAKKPVLTIEIVDDASSY